MRRETVLELLPLIKAWGEGQDIQLNKASEGRPPRWEDLAHPSFGGDPERYRIKPEPVVTYHITFNSKNSTNVYTWQAVGEEALNRKISEITAVADRKILYIVKEEDGVRTILPSA